MFTWLRNLFVTKPEPLILIDPVEVREEVSVLKNQRRLHLKRLVHLPLI